VTADHTTFTNNDAVAGGAIVVGAASTLNVTASTVDHNDAVSAGGLWVLDTASATLSSTSITNNTAAATAANTGLGGAIYNGGSLSVTDGSISNNVATPIAGQLNNTGLGGAIYSGSTNANAIVTVALSRVLMTGNRANTASAIYAVAPTKTSLRDSTVTANQSAPGAGSIVSSGTMSLVGDTINANTSPSGTNFLGGVYSFAPTIAAGTIIYGNSDGNCFGAPTDGGYNLTNPGDTGCAFNAATDKKADPQLDPLANNGGPTQTEAPRPSSPVINAIPNPTTSTITDAVTGTAVTLCPGVDQRGVARPQGPACDIGAVEIGNQAPSAIVGPASATFVTGTAGTVGFSSTGVPTPHLAASGPLPSGVTFVDNGDGTATLGGTAAPGTAGNYPLTITASNGNTPDQTLSFTLTVVEPLAITTTTLPHAVVGDPYSTALTASGGATPYAWTLDSGTLPAGLNLAPDGTIGGTPSGPAGTSTFTVRVADSTPATPDATKTLTIVVDTHPTISGPSSATFVTGQAKSVGFTSTGSPTPTLSESGALPAGVTFTPGPIGSGTGTLGGTAAAGTHGTYVVTISASNGVGAPATLTFTLTVVEPLVITTNALPDGTVGTPYSASLGATGGTPAYTWSLASGSLPSGLSLAPDGTISGTPTGPRGTSTFTVQVTDHTSPDPLTSTRALSILIHATPTQLTADPALIRIVFPGIFVTLQNLKAHLTSGPAHTPVVGATIQFSVSGTVYCAGITDSTGTAQCPGLNPSMLLAMIVANGFDATYAGSPTLEPASAHGPLILVG
jgi:hypothetical protein